MTFQCEIKAISEATKIASAATGRKSIPVLEHLLLEWGEGRITATGTDLDQRISAWRDAACTEAGAAVVRADMLAKWLATCPAGGLIHGVYINDGLRLTCGRSWANLPSLPVTDFPMVTREKGQEIVGGCDAFASCLPFAEKPGAARFYLQGVNFTSNMAMASDGHYARNVACGYDGPPVIIPHFALPAVRNAGAGGRLFASRLGWSVEAEGMAASGRVIDGDWPEWSRLLGRVTWTGEADADGLLGAIRAAVIGTAPRVSLSARDDEIIARGEDWPADRRSEASGSCAYQGGRFILVFQTVVIEPPLSSLAGGVVKIGWNGNGLVLASGDAVCMAFPWHDVRSEAPEMEAEA